MSLVSSHHQILFHSNAIQQENLSELVRLVTRDILRDVPGLITDTESGKAPKSLLKDEIIKRLDQYYQAVDRNQIVKDVLDYIFGYGILQKYIEDEEITDIDGMGRDYFTCRRGSYVERLPIAFESDEAFENYCKLLIIRNGGLINENDTHARVADENFRLRINVAIAPRNLTGPSINIRKHKLNAPNLEQLSDMGMMPPRVAGVLRDLAGTSARILLVGKGGAGKTTLLRAILEEVPVQERILVCESDSELYPNRENTIVQRVKKEHEGGRTVTLQDIVRDGLTMSLDGYCVGEITGTEAWDFIRAGFTDHKIYGTIHGIGTQAALDRLLTLMDVHQAGIGVERMSKVIAESLDVVIYLRDFKVMEIGRVAGYDGHFIVESLYSSPVKGRDESVLTGLQRLKQCI